MSFGLIAERLHSKDAEWPPRVQIRICGYRGDFYTVDTDWVSVTSHAPADALFAGGARLTTGDTQSTFRNIILYVVWVAVLGDSGRSRMVAV